jgi:hypothetical protein
LEPSAARGRPGRGGSQWEYSRARSTRGATTPLAFRAVLGRGDAFDLAAAAEQDAPISSYRKRFPHLHELMQDS